MKNKIIDGFNHVFGRHGFDYSEINEQVFIGTNMCCQHGFDVELLKKGVRADISLEQEKVDAPMGVDYFLWLPTEDQHAPSPEKLELGVQTLAFFQDRRVKVYIHCKNGHGRATLLYAAYLTTTGMGLEEALASIKEKRPSVHLNEAQMKALKAFAQMI